MTEFNDQTRMGGTLASHRLAILGPTDMTPVMPYRRGVRGVVPPPNETVEIKL